MFEEVDQFKYLDSPQTKDGTSLKEVKIRLVQQHSTMTRLAVLWINKGISYLTKIKLYKPLVLWWHERDTYCLHARIALVTIAYECNN